jgi:magnesium chelatase subunit D
MDEKAPARWLEALQVAALFALDPAGLGGVVVRAAAGPVRERWLAEVRRLLAEGAPVRRVPLHTDDERLLGGIDLAATLAAGRPVAWPGLLAEADGGVVLLAMAERVSPGAAARIAAVLDSGRVTAARDGVVHCQASRFGLVALDEGIAEEGAPPALLDRLAFHIDLGAIAPREALVPAEGQRARIAAARPRLADVQAGDDIAQALCSAAALLGIVSMRPALLALRVARALAALDGRDSVDAGDAARAAGLVFGPRARTAPPGHDSASDGAAKTAAQAPDDRPPPAPAEAPSDAPSEASGEPLGEVVLEAALAAIPGGLLRRLAGDCAAPSQRTSGAGGWQSGARRGAPIAARQARPRGGQRLALIETLRAAAPWQRLRAPAAGAGDRVRLRVEDFRIKRFRQRSTTTTIFVVDASGSSALHRLAEAKGAVELLLADCYVRRDQVAVLAFRGHAAEVLMAPTRSLVRAKRCLAELPGGGGTPLAAALDATYAMAEAVRRRGALPMVVLLTDGRANVDRQGNGGRVRAEADALDAARRLRAAGHQVLLIDTSPQAQPQAERLAAAMQATYLRLPHAGARSVSGAVREAQRIGGLGH